VFKITLTGDKMITVSSGVGGPTTEIIRLPLRSAIELLWVVVMDAIHHEWYFPFQSKNENHLLP
jgi:hypothetical protein